MDAPSSQQSTALQLTEVVWQFNAAFQRWSDLQVPELGVSTQRLRLMYALQQKGELKMCELKTHLGVTATNITALVTALEKDGWVTRRMHPQDRRASLVALTPQALARLDTSCAQFRERVASLFESLSATEADLLLQTLGKLHAELQRREK